MLSKLIENWLDNASERSYQPAFCQMLISRGYTVIHSTRHCPIEYGKDVLAIASDGIPCAFQLKGNAGSSLTHSQYREIRPQLDEMLNQRIEHPSISPDLPHRSYLVTNGRIEEEVSLAVSQANAKNAQDGYPHRKLQTIAREQLLGWALELEDALWPSELSEFKILLEIITFKGDELFPIDKFHTLLASLFKLSAEDQQTISNPEFARRLSSGALLTAVALKPFSECGNHWAVTVAWVMFAVYASGLADKYQKRTGLLTPSLKVAEEVIAASLEALLDEASKRNGRYWQGNGIADFPVYRWRYTLIMGIGSLYWLECKRTGCWPSPDFKAALETMLPTTQAEMSLWGEAAIPQFLLHEWYLKAAGLESANHHVVGLATTVLNKPLFWAYYSAEEIIRHELSLTFEAFASKITQDLEGQTKSSHFAEAMMIHLAQRSLKEACQALWKRYTHVTSLAFLPAKRWMYCLSHAEEGDNHMNLPPETGQWADLVTASQTDVEVTVPGALAQRPLLLALWCLIVPQRAVTSAVCHLYKGLAVPQGVVSDAA